MTICRHRYHANSLVHSTIKKCSMSSLSIPMIKGHIFIKLFPSHASCMIPIYIQCIRLTWPKEAVNIVIVIMHSNLQFNPPNTNSQQKKRRMSFLMLDTNINNGWSLPFITNPVNYSVILLFCYSVQCISSMPH